jgi:phosphotransferase system  glucose/maltose/N-acetylglucosamine-specific IIC component
MNASIKDAGMKDRKVGLSALWIFAMFNYIYADVFTLFFNPAAQTETLATPQGPVVVFAILMETAIVMVLLSRFLKYSANRWANIIAGIFHTVFVAWSLTGSTQPLFYIFFACIEMVCTLFIAWYAWKWRNPESQPELQSVRTN